MTPSNLNCEKAYRNTRNSSKDSDGDSVRLRLEANSESAPVAPIPSIFESKGALIREWDEIWYNRIPTSDSSVLSESMPSLDSKVNRFGPDSFPGSKLSPHEQYVAYTGHKASFVPARSESNAEMNFSLDETLALR